MKRDTKRIEQLLKLVSDARDLVREEIKSGSSLQHEYDSLGSMQNTFGQRLKDLNAYNKTVMPEAEAEAKAKAKAESKKKK